MRRYFLSICIPTYNRASFFRECLQSIFVSLEGYEKKVEVVILDNASTDNTSTVVAEYQYRIRNIRYYRNKILIDANQNISKVAQLGEGEYLWVFGDDDKIDKHAVPAIIKQIENGCNLVVMNVIPFSDELGQRGKSPYYSVRSPLFINDHNLVMKTFGATICFISEVVMHHSIVQNRTDNKLELGVEYGFPFLPAIYSSLSRHCAVRYISEALVFNRTGNSGKYDWDTYFINNFAILLRGLRDNGYSGSSLRAAKNKIILFYILWQVVKRKLLGGFWHDIYTRLWQYYRDCWTFWIICMPLALMPGFLLRTFRIVKRCIWRS
jgi:glycosyltransferase involved in cell wall biosynthesis